MSSRNNVCPTQYMLYVNIAPLEGPLYLVNVIM